MPMLMLVIIASLALGGILMTTMLDQAHATRFAQSRVHDLDAAQAGLDVMLGQVRAATTSGGVGDDSKLPCGVVQGSTDDAGTGSYTATITYYLGNPAAQNAVSMQCTSAGPYDPASASRTPRYAVITSTGTDQLRTSGGSKGRTLEATYAFQTNDVNLVGGQIRIFPAGGAQYCMDAGTSPTVGTPVLLRPCSTSNPPADQQVWAYRPDLSIELVASALTATPLCIDTTSTPHAAGLPIVLKQCSVADASVCPAGQTPTSYAAANPGKTCAISTWRQQWSVDNAAHLEGALSDDSDIDHYCINAAAQTSGTALALASCAGSVTDTAQTWVPSPTTGAGLAGAGNQQLVNYRQFAMCLDITGTNVSSPFEILYTCKQNPNPAKVLWNQKFTPSPALAAGPTRTLLTTTASGVTYCLKSPRAVGGYPVLATPCPAGVSSAGPGFVWTVSQRYTDSTMTRELRYADKYTIKDDSGLCLGIGANNDLYNGVYSKAVVVTCDGSTGQKWNADPSLDAATVTNLHEK